MRNPDGVILGSGVILWPYPYQFEHLEGLGLGIGLC